MSRRRRHYPAIDGAVLKFTGDLELAQALLQVEQDRFDFESDHPVEVTLHMLPEAAAALSAAAGLTGSTRNSVGNLAAYLYLWIAEQEDAGNRIAVIDAKSGQTSVYQLTRLSDPP